MDSTEEIYSMLELPVIPNFEGFECSICCQFCQPNDGVILHECNHSFCRNCTVKTITASDFLEIACPGVDSGNPCEFFLLDQEISYLLDEKDYQLYQKKPSKNAKAQDFELKPIIEISESAKEVYSMIELPVIPNYEAFECSICYELCEPFTGVVLHECNHLFCRDCIISTIVNSDSVEIGCPAMDSGNPCQFFLLDQEIRYLLDKKDYEKYQIKCLTIAEARAATESFHCLKNDCSAWVFYDVNSPFSFLCPLCRTDNCINCKAVHPGKSCIEYNEDKLMNALPNDLKNEVTIKRLVDRREAMLCPKCGVVVVKISGCDHLRCLMCKFEFQWLANNGLLC